MLSEVALLGIMDMVLAELGSNSLEMVPLYIPNFVVWDPHAPMERGRSGVAHKHVTLSHVWQQGAPRKAGGHNALLVS